LRRWETIITTTTTTTTITTTTSEPCFDQEIFVRGCRRWKAINALILSQTMATTHCFLLSKIDGKVTNL